MNEQCFPFPKSVHYILVTNVNIEMIEYLKQLWVARREGFRQFSLRVRAVDICYLKNMS